jgi:Protein of unknown function (DUF3617)
MKIRLGLIVLAGIAGVAASDIPHRKPGLWEMTSHSSRSQGSDILRRICLDPQMEDLLNRQSVASAAETCSKTEMHASGNQFTVKAACSLGRVKMVSEAITTFVSDTASTTTVHTTFEPPMLGRSQDDTVETAKWLSACPADMQPGDMILKTGGSHPHEMRTSLRQMFKQQP